MLFLMIGLRFTLVYPYLKTYCFHWYENFINLLMPYLTPINNLFQLNGIYLTVAVSLDWYFLIKEKRTIRYSLKRKWFKKKTWWVVFCIFTLCSIFTLPNWFLYKSNVYLMEIKSDNLQSQITQTTTKKLISFIRASKTDFGNNQITKNLIQIYFYIPFVFAIPVLILLIVNFLIIKIIIRVNRQKKKLGNSVQIDRSITVMLVLIIILFLICQIPIMVSNIISSFTPDITSNNNSFILFNTFSNFFLCLNLSCNFGIYCIFNEKFRETTKFIFFHKTFCKSGTLQKKLSHKIINCQQQRSIIELDKIEDNTQFELTFNIRRNFQIKNYTTRIQLVTTA
jgi:hypothetical protein